MAHEHSESRLASPFLHVPSLAKLEKRVATSGDKFPEKQNTRGRVNELCDLVAYHPNTATHKFTELASSLVLVKKIGTKCVLARTSFCDPAHIFPA